MLREGVQVIVLDSSDKVLLLRRHSGYWQFVQGGKEENESPEQCLIRELREEASLDEGDIETIKKLNVKDSFESNGIEFEYHVFLVRCKFPEKASIDNNHVDEHDAIKWFTLEEAEKMLRWPNQKVVLEVVRKEL